MQEFDKVPMFMKTAPENIDAEKHPDLACIQSIIHDDDRTPEGVRTSAKQFISLSSFWLFLYVSSVPPLNYSLIQ